MTADPTGRDAEDRTLAGLDFTPTCTVVDIHPGCPHPDTPCTQPAATIVGVHDCRTGNLYRTAACVRHTQILADRAISKAIHIVRSGNKCPTCGMGITKPNQLFTWEEM